MFTRIVQVICTTYAIIVTRTRVVSCLLNTHCVLRGERTLLYSQEELFNRRIAFFKLHDRSTRFMPETVDAMQPFRRR